MEPRIRAIATVATQKLSLETTAKRNRLLKWFTLKLRKRVVKNSILAINVLVLFAVLAIVVHNSSAAQVNNQIQVTGVGTANNVTQTNPLDQLSSAQIAVQVARMTGIYEATSVTNLADSQSASINVIPSDNQVINKPTIIATSAKSRQDIVQYITQPGDTVSSLAIKFGVTSNSILWSNSISANTLSPGLTLFIPPINGIVYTVKPGDTAASLGLKYNADPTQITSFNDAEITGLQPNEQIVIPNASAPTVTLAANSSYGSGYGGGNSYSFGYGPIYGYNGYDYGYCTWWVAQRRAEVGLPIPSNLGNASTWYDLAQAAGIPTGSTPQKYAVVWFGYYANHVAFVESVNADGSIVISEMNRINWNMEDTRTIPASEVGSYRYIY